ncbi:Hsp20/alpha crystallin family protein [Pseudomonas zhanjiangensis]|uniref:Hsp20/alpha crystallin family protein n=1 Tax=Pseudomonas zhanjiangensis TaxID=3239015 RepID=A0ABV3YVL6_9PSED
MSEKPVVKRNERKEDAQALLPRVDVRENKDGILLIADMPGVPKDKLELHIDNDTLTIEGEITPDTPENMEAVYAEVRLSRYRRAFSLSAELDTARIDAQLSNGVLKLRIPKHAYAQPRKIEVKVA